MYLKRLTAVIVLIMSMDCCLAEQPSVRIDMTAQRLVPAFAAIPFVFEDSNLDCPEDRGTIAMTDGVLKRIQLSPPRTEEAPLVAAPAMHMTFNPIDDATYRLQFIRTNCRVDIDIRQQLREGDHWRSLPVIEERRPSLSAEARQDAVDKRLGRLGDLTKPGEGQQMSLADLNRMLRSGSPKRWGISTLSFGFPFDGAPKSCMESLGEYQITKNSFAMAFFAPLPGELNKFVMEGSDLDPSHARISLTKDDCRFEFTVSQSTLRDGQWLALPLRSIPGNEREKPDEPNR